MRRLALAPRIGLTLALTCAAAPRAQGQDSWDALYLGKQKVGYVHTTARPVEGRTGRPLRRARVETVLEIKRGDRSLSGKTEFGAIEDPDGVVLRVDYREGIAGQFRVWGDRDQARNMALTVEAGGSRRQVAVPWGDDVWGPGEPEASLERRPMKPGERRTGLAFRPEKPEVVEASLSAGQFEVVELLSGAKRSLLRVELTAKDAQGRLVPDLRKTLWIDSFGITHKSTIAIFNGLNAFRTDEPTARKPSDDIEAVVTLRPTRPIRSAGDTRRMVYKVTAKEGGLGDLFPTDRRQELDPRTGRLTVSTVARDAGPAGPERVEAGYLKPSPLIDSQHPAVAAKLREALAGEVAPGQKAAAIAEWVGQSVKPREIASLEPASRAAETLSGNNYSCSSLAAAMCRAAGIPARIVLGLAYDRAKGHFSLYFWDEVYVDRRWVAALDPTLKQTDVDATHIKCAEVPPDGNPAEVLIDVSSRVLSRGLELEPIEVR